MRHTLFFSYTDDWADPKKQVNHIKNYSSLSWLIILIRKYLFKVWFLFFLFFWLEHLFFSKCSWKTRDSLLTYLVWFAFWITDSFLLCNLGNIYPLTLAGLPHTWIVKSLICLLVLLFYIAHWKFILGYWLDLWKWSYYQMVEAFTVGIAGSTTNLL